MTERRKRHIPLNPDEPETGDFAWTLYDRSRPKDGEQETIDYFRKQLKGLRGKRIRIVLHGTYKNPRTQRERPFRVSRTLTMNSYNDIFGSGAAYQSMLKQVLEVKSDWMVIGHYFDITYDA